MLKPHPKDIINSFRAQWFYVQTLLCRGLDIALYRNFNKYPAPCYAFQPTLTKPNPLFKATLTKKSPQR